MKNKKAFTLAELLVAMFIVGIIVALAIFTVERYDKGIRFLYSNTYHVLDRALYNAMNFSDLANPFLSVDVDENGESYDVSPEEGAARLCMWLDKYINTNSTSCTPGNLALEDGQTFGEVKLAASNGVNYYISRRLPDSDNPKLREGDPPFFLIYADINGAEGQNSMYYEPPTDENKHIGVDPDVFAFAALNTGRVCPLGVPEVDPRYMQTRLAYSTFVTNEDAGEDTVRYTVVSKPYYISKAEAWGYYLNAENQAEKNRIFMDDEPTTYNDYIRDVLPEDTKIYEYFAGAQLRVPEGVHLLSGKRSQGEYGCVAFSDEECWVIIDKYLY